VPNLLLSGMRRLLEIASKRRIALIDHD